MAVMQFGFSDDGAHTHLPHRAAGKIIYTGTHDNDTTAGWYKSGAAEHERRNAEAYLGRGEDGIHWAFIRAALSSPAELALIPLQDVLGLGSNCRMNTPSRDNGNWKWRFSYGQFDNELTTKLARLVEVTDRKPPAIPVRPSEDFAA
jgi:4-alpha-glucanotransferase